MVTAIKWKGVTFEKLPLGTIFLEEQPVSGHHTISIKESEKVARQLSTTNPQNWQYDGEIIMEDDLYEDIYYAPQGFRNKWDWEV